MLSTADPFEIAESLGMSVEYRQYGKSVKGYFRKIFDRVFIVINSNYCGRSQRIICAHELGHALLHTDIPDRVTSMSFEDCNPDGFEHEANIFAAALLIDEEKLSCSISDMSNYIIKGIFDINMKYVK